MNDPVIRPPAHSAIQQLAGELSGLRLTCSCRIMEVCGGHTAAIHRHGLKALIPSGIELVSGPGCPVCVTETVYIDHAIQLAQRDNTTIATFGDLARVPGSCGTLNGARSRGADIRIVYSPLDALRFAAKNPKREVVLLAIGFETTAGPIAETLGQAIDSNQPNFKVLCGLKTMPNALRVLLSDPETSIDGLILPGHVAVITGTEPFRFIPAEFGVSCSVSGFEAIDLLDSIYEIVCAIRGARPDLTNRYCRAVRDQGNVAARKLIDRVFVKTPSRWRGLGEIADSGLRIRDEYAKWDAGTIPVHVKQSVDHPSCRCSEILRGAAKPIECPLFGTTCTPDAPIGACMVSSEGACAAVYQFEDVAPYA